MCLMWGEVGTYSAIKQHELRKKKSILNTIDTHFFYMENNFNENKN